MQLKFFLLSSRPSQGIASVCFFLVIVLLVTDNVRFGLHLSSDSETFIRWSGLLIDSNFNLFDYYLRNQFISPPIFYTVPVFYIAFCKYLFISTWQQIYFISNLVFMVATIFLFKKSAELLGVRHTLVAFLLPFFLVSTDYLIWPHFLLTDTVFAFLVMFCVYSALLCTLTDQCNTLQFGIAVVLLLLTRPSSPPVVGAIFLYVLLSKEFPNFLRNRMGMFSAVLLLGTCSTLAYSYIMAASLNGDIFNKQINFLSNFVAYGVVIHDRPETFIAVGHSVGDISQLYFLRILYFFTPYVTSFSFWHKFANCVLLGLFFLGLLLWALCGYQSANYSRKLQRGSQLILLLSLFVAMYQAATVIDFDWRYRYPLIAPLILFSGISFEQALRELFPNRVAFGEKC